MLRAFSAVVIVGGEMVGAVGLHGETEPAEIGYSIGRRYWGRGFASAAVGLLIEEARRLKVGQLAAEVFPDNAASMRVLEKKGFICGNVVQRDLAQGGGLRDLIRFEALLTPA